MTDSQLEALATLCHFGRCFTSRVTVGDVVHWRAGRELVKRGYARVLDTGALEATDHGRTAYRLAMEVQ